jgi:hypothetical protein
MQININSSTLSVFFYQITISVDLHKYIQQIIRQHISPVDVLFFYFSTFNYILFIFYQYSRYLKKHFEIKKFLISFVYITFFNE